MKTITYEECLDKDSIAYIDVRTPKEFAESTIPDAINIPIFTNQEHSKIGTIYTQKSPAEARLLAVDLVSPKIPSFIRKIKNLTKEYEDVVIFCARGGMRSESIAVFCKLAGLKVYKLTGGYKSYRHFILDELENYKLQSRLVVLHGFTGVGKTELLYRLEAAGIPIIDLEGLANHRGSAFGSMGLGQPTNPKMFDSLLWEKLQELEGKSIIAIEAESKRVGISVVPEFLLEAIANGVHILIQRSLSSRVKLIIDEYKGSYEEDYQSLIDQAVESISAIQKHIIKKTGKKNYERLINLCQDGELEKVVSFILKNYYDPLYQYSQDKYDNFALEIQEDNLAKINQRIIEFINESLD
ncbi:tRNA 2-selenouridine(34) synthase MnmH [Orenia marismortui]|uniref:tRNA 2-selenouridine synthase n=1 Tax=Orenia marismortui TaxID=46469 RepID=A0A4R8H0S9_9FIRM|nr:tRNA 2-selenouridine(34) synthase MnmH [Orenia marismortui]TDX53152.1 tRNA 2-selenouridine synthase [Orenia marismortui]